MSEQWTYVITAPRGETIELKHLHEYLRGWKHATQCDEAGRAWTISASEAPVQLEYQGRSKRADLVNRITCTLSSRAAADDRQLAMSFADKVSTELGWSRNDPFERV